ncbi:MAG TPA: glycoside hydrolase family protein [Candidatus Eisenbergiella merdavium]|uniref:Lysozyme n=1 Tax=Candidatus Eisenbergiella merdavium TaxID=2838551 RepID=A0A9D2NE86_9FIRM|nr:glycoside hydrolase family protein [Candidatus Eisenbergiella merdavium]
MSFTTSQAGIDLITSFEGCRLTAYQDSVGVWTIGYGHTSGVYQGMTITEEEAIAFLRQDLKTAENAVNSYVTYAINQSQFDALVSFTFNVGTGNLSSSTLLKKLNAGDINGAANEFDKWIYAGGEVLEGLVRRRAAEKQMFLSGSWEGGGVVDPDPTGDSTIRAFQLWLNENYNSGLTADGIYGTNTKKAATKAYQQILGVTPDGIFGSDSKAAVTILKAGDRGNDVHLLQGMLYCRGFNPNGVDGIFGNGTTTAVKNFQANRGLSADGLAGPDTMYALYN